MLAIDERANGECSNIDSDSLIYQRVKLEGTRSDETGQDSPAERLDLRVLPKHDALSVDSAP